MNLPLNCVPTPDQLAADHWQDVLDDDVHCAFVNQPGSLLGANDMLGNSRSNSNITYHQMLSPNHYAQPSVGPWTSGDSWSSTDHNHRNFTISQDLTIPPPPPPQIDSYSTAATNILPSVSDFGSWNNTPTLHSTQYHNPALGRASIGYSSFAALGSGYSSLLTPQEVYPNGRSSQSNIFSQHTVASHTPFVLDPTMPAFDFSPYNILPHQWQIHAVPQPGPSSLSVTPMIPPPLDAEPSRFIFVMQPHASHGEQTGYPSNQPPVHQPYSFPLHAYPSSSLLSCRWLNDDAVTHCGFTGTLKALESHCKTIHFTGTRIAQIECHWEGCDYYKRNDPTVRVMRRDCMWRHTCEVHLRLKRGSI